MIMTKEERRDFRKKTFAEMEQRLMEWNPREEDRLFYFHSSEDRVALSHALLAEPRFSQFLELLELCEKYKRKNQYQ